MGDVGKHRAGAGPLTGSHMQPSSSTAGFFQERPRIENQFYEDSGLRRVLECTWSPHESYMPREGQLLNRPSIPATEHPKRNSA